MNEMKWVQGFLNTGYITADCHFYSVSPEQPCIIPRHGSYQTIITLSYEKHINLYAIVMSPDESVRCLDPYVFGEDGFIEIPIEIYDDYKQSVDGLVYLEIITSGQSRKIPIPCHFERLAVVDKGDPYDQNEANLGDVVKQMPLFPYPITNIHQEANLLIGETEPLAALASFFYLGAKSKDWLKVLYVMAQKDLASLNLRLLCIYGLIQDRAYDKALQMIHALDRHLILLDQVAPDVSLSLEFFLDLMRPKNGDSYRFVSEPIKDVRWWSLFVIQNDYLKRDKSKQLNYKHFKRIYEQGIRHPLCMAQAYDWIVQSLYVPIVSDDYYTKIVCYGISKFGVSDRFCQRLEQTGYYLVQQGYMTIDVPQVLYQKVQSKGTLRLLGRLWCEAHTHHLEAYYLYESCFKAGIWLKDLTHHYLIAAYEQSKPIHLPVLKIGMDLSELKEVHRIFIALQLIVEEQDVLLTDYQKRYPDMQTLTKDTASYRYAKGQWQDGKRHPILLAWLSEDFHGDLETMALLTQALLAHNMSGDTFYSNFALRAVLCKRYSEILEALLERWQQQGVQHLVYHVVLRFFAARVLIEEVPVSTTVFSALLASPFDDSGIDVACIKLAHLRKTDSESALEHIHVLVERYREKGICLDSHYFTYYGAPLEQVVYHYRLPEASDFLEKPMIHLDFGLFYVKLLLFYGESVQYYITAVKDHEMDYVMSDLYETMLFTQAEETGTPLDWINHIEMCRVTQDEIGVEAGVKAYFNQEEGNLALWKLL